MKSRALVLIAGALFAAASMFAQEKPQEKKDPAAEKKKADKNELPLEMPKKLEFETDEGTWISLDVTPDGRNLVFELLGDLYRVPVAPGSKHPRTKDERYKQETLPSQQ